MKARSYKSTPRERGIMDAYYRSRLGCQPHCYIIGTDGPKSPPIRIEKADMTPKEIEEYFDGFEQQAKTDDRWEDEGDY